MPVRLDKDPPEIPAANTGISAFRRGAGASPSSAAPLLGDPAPAAGPTPAPGAPPQRATPAARRRDAEPVPAPNGTAGAAAPVSGRGQGRVALASMFLLGSALAGGVGYAAAAGSDAKAQAAQHKLAASRTAVRDLRSQLNQSRAALSATSDRLVSTNSALTKAQAGASDLAARAASVKVEENQVAQRSAEVAKRERATAAREASVQVREAALASPEVGHPLPTTVSDDGTWTVGRDIKPGTWSALADDTGCSWRTSDGRKGSGDGGYDMMEVVLSSGQKFTVHGCTLWSTYDF